MYIQICNAPSTNCIFQICHHGESMTRYLAQIRGTYLEFKYVEVTSNQQNVGLCQRSKNKGKH